MPFVTDIVKEIVPMIDATYRTIPDREHRAMAGNLHPRPAGEFSEGRDFSQDGVALGQGLFGRGQGPGPLAEPQSKVDEWRLGQFLQEEPVTRLRRAMTGDSVI